MEKINLNQELQLTFPDGFHVMDAEERSRLNFIAEGPGECLNDPERHAVVSVGWKKSGLSAMMLRTGEIAKSMEKQTAKSLEPFGYRLEEFVSVDLDGLTAEGFRFMYDVEDIGMTGTSLVVKRKKMFYFLHLYTRTALREENLPMLEEILAGAKWLS